MTFLNKKKKKKKKKKKIKRNEEYDSFKILYHCNKYDNKTKEMNEKFMRNKKKKKVRWLCVIQSIVYLFDNLFWFYCINNNTIKQ